MNTPAPTPAQPNQFALLRQRRFAPFFWTQFLGAANDNLFKFAVTVLVTYQISVSWLPVQMAGLVIGALFILPFVLFSATSGQLSDKLEKRRLMVTVKALEIAIMALAVYGLWAPHVGVLLACIFLMGCHSTLFGPAKFAYLPQYLEEHEITGGNGMVEMGTFVAILLGNMAGGLLVAVPDVGVHLVAVACLSVAVIGWLTARRIPALPASAPDLKINWNPFTETWANIRMARGNRTVFRTMLAISWMWFFGAVFLSQFPAFAKLVLHGDEQVASLLLVAFSVGVGTGALLCERLSKGSMGLWLVPIGAIGMSVFTLDLYFASHALPQVPLMNFATFMGQAHNWRVVADSVLLSLFTGLYSVPMYALVQLRTQPSHRARIIATNNILNALFMIASSLIVGSLLGHGVSIPGTFALMALANVAVNALFFVVTPDYMASLRERFSRG